MSEFKKYAEVERLDKEDCDGILMGVCHIFPKIDGTNASIWFADGKIRYGSRNRELEEGGKDNFDFATKYRQLEGKGLSAFFDNYPLLYLFGEYLVPHTLRTYREEAWNKFYVFDVYDTVSASYLPFENYVQILDKYEISYVPLIMTINNPTEEQLKNLVQSNSYLIKDGKGVGEGIVIKHYGWENKFGHHVFGKMVRNEFKEQNQHAFYKKGQLNEGAKQTELEIAAKYVTEGRVEKIISKMKSSLPWTDKRIPELLGHVYHEIVVEEMWEIVKEFHQPTINFKRLNQAVIQKIKYLKPEIF